MTLIDAHAHLSFFTEDQLAAIFQKAKQQGISAWVMAGYDLPDWHKQQIIAQQHPGIKTSFGLHPWRVLALKDDEIEAQMQELAEMLPQAQACGETGIDGFRTADPALLRKQKNVFERHLELNTSWGLPLVLHIVKAHDESIDLLKRYSYRGIVHGFSGSWETAKRYIALGYKISLGRGIYQKGFRNLKETAAKIDLADFVLESDAYVTDDGAVEDPIAILSQVAQALSEIKSMPLEKIGRASCENVKTVFG
jgi:TatD DNase family protein